MRQPNHRLGFQALAEQLSDVATRLVDSPNDADLRCTVMLDIKRSSAAAEPSNVITHGHDAIIANQYSKIMKKSESILTARPVHVQTSAKPPLPSKRPEPDYETVLDAPELPPKPFSRGTPVLQSAQTQMYGEDYLPQSADDDGQIETEV